jgi:4'-phosphopantetheinyl transferase
MQQVTLHVAYGATALPGLAAGATVLDADEQARAACLRLHADREIYCAAHVLLRHALSRQVPMEPGRWRFVRGAHGRPEIDIAACPDAAGLRFNLTHTRGLVCCALTREQPIGVDAECRRRMADTRAIAERFFAPDEAAAVAASGAPGSAAEAATFRALWTLKEAYIKALGRGLSMGLDGFAFRVLGEPPARIELTCAEGAAHWRCVLLDVAGGRCTLAAALPAPGGARFQVFLHDAEPAATAPRLGIAACTRGVELLPFQVPGDAVVRP